MKFRAPTSSLLAAFALFACSSNNGAQAPGTGAGGSSGSTSSLYTPGCTNAPACGTCGSCIQQCFCVEQDIDKCSMICADPGTGGSSSVPPGGTSTAPTGTTTPPTGTTTPPTGTTTPPTGTTTPPTGTTTPPTTPPANELSITTVPFDVAPGAEEYKCQNFQNRAGQDIAIVKSQSFMSAGSHHMFVFDDASFNTDTNAVADCSGSEFHDFLLLSQQPQEVETYPAGVGRSLTQSTGLRVILHYLNNTSSTITAQVNAKFDWVQPSAVTYLAAQMELNQGILTVPEGVSTQSHSYTVPYDIDIMYAISHMHKRGTHFHAATNTNQVIYDGTVWDEPQPTLYNPPLLVQGNSTITWSCDYDNQTGMTLTFGESAATNEMCILFTIFYPTATGANQGKGLDSLL
jgi:hypothetical protein